MTQRRTCSRGHEFKGEEPCPVCLPDYRTFTVQAKVWLYQGEAAWHFVHVPKNESTTIRERFGAVARGWSSLRVRVILGGTSWQTSVFWDKKTGQYLLPLKTAVRKAEGVAAGDTVAFTLEILA